MPQHNRKFSPLLAALVLSTAGTAGAVSVSFTNGSSAGVVDVYVDGVKTFSSMMGYSPSFFPVSIAAGKHHVVVTRVGQAPGTADLMSKDMDLQYAQVWTFKPDNATFQTYKISVTTGGD